MSIILSGLIHVFRPLLSSLSGALDCEGLGPWYFLLGLRIVAIFFANGPWDTMKEDVTCNFVAPIEDRSRYFCMALCHNQHFPLSIAGTWSLGFIALLLLVGLMRLTRPKKKKKREKESEKLDKDRGLAVVGTAHHGSGPDFSTVYWVGRRGLPRRHGNTSYHPPYMHHPYHPHYAHYDGWHDWADWHGPPVAHMAGGHDAEMGGVPGDVGGYGMPVHTEHMGQAKMPDHYYDTPEPKMGICPTDNRQMKMTPHCPGTDQCGMRTHQSPMKQTHFAPHDSEKGQYNAPTKCVPVPINSSPYKGKIPLHCQTNEEHGQTLHPAPYGAGKSPDYACTAGSRTRCTTQGKMLPRYCEDGQYTMASKCRPDTEGSMEQLPVHPQLDDNTNTAIKRRSVPGSKMPTKHHGDFDAAGRSNPCTQPWMASDPTGRPIDGKNVMSGPRMATVCCHGDVAYTGADPCHMAPPYEPPCEPCCSAPCAHDRHWHGETHAGPQEKAKSSITNICGVPFFDIWVALLLAMEIVFLCVVIVFQLPTLFGRTFICSPGAVSCPPAVECTVKGRAEKRMALWGLAFTAMLFIIACSGYFNIRFCWNKSCRQRCSEKEGASEEDCPEDTEGQDGEEGGEENREGA
ncbi:hypothetical protein JRQ81_006015 [Phrynocephalus forsythii]|uniref:Uncharacterized protein n=1 Tax=Phrynocephalus forsythii TaxID=171643 RepID=A0A9Q1AW70_9SAUR|nr:hypothetical protein JRQ81_006015 [Phrynocephalus forsythii]